MSTLVETLEQHQLDVDPAVVSLLDRYREQLWSWNERLNLTRHTTLEKFVTRDVLDSLQLAELLPRGDRILDVGTGGGVPGMIMAILRPDLHVTLCESTGKKARAVESIRLELDLQAPVHHARAEDILGIRSFDTLVARAVAPLSKLLSWFSPHWDAFGQLLVIKGRSWAEERGVARQAGLLAGLNLRRASIYQTPDGAESVILRIWPDRESLED